MSFFRAFVLLALLLTEGAEASESNAEVCPMRLPATKAGDKPRVLDYVSAYLGSPIVIVKPERYELSANRFRWVWLVNRDDFFIECRYAGGKRIQVRVPSSAASCEMRAHKLGQHNYRPYSIACH